MDKMTEQYRQQFYTEAREILDRLGDDVLRAEADPEDGELLNAIFRGIHTIKGSAGSFDLDEIAAFAHHLEGLLSACRKRRTILSPEVVDLILAGADYLGRMIEARAAGDDSIPMDAGLIRRLRLLSGDADNDPARPPTPEPCPESAEPSSGGAEPFRDSAPAVPGPSETLPQTLSEADRDRIEAAAAIGLNLFRVRTCFTSEMLENGYDPMVFLDNLRSAATAYAVAGPPAVLPPLSVLSPLTLYLSPEVYVATALSEHQIRELTFDPSLIDVAPIRAGSSGLDAEPLDEFVEGAVDMLESIEKSVIDYETSGSRESLNAIFRVVHNVKGDADLIGLREITLFAHSLETLLDRLRAGAIQRSFALVDVILQSVDFLRQAVLRLGQGISVPEFPPVFETLKQYAAMRNDMDRAAHPLMDAPPDLAEAFTQQALQYKALLHRYALRPTSDPATRALLNRALTGLSGAAGVVGLRSLSGQADKAREALASGAFESFSEAVQKIIAFIESLAGERPPAPAAEMRREAPPPEKPLSGPKTASLRIDAAKVDHFTNLAGELRIARNTYDHLLDQLSGGGGADREILKSLKENLRLFSRLTNDIHHGVMALRMVPVGRIFDKFNRTVRDIGRRKKRPIRLMTGGGGIEIDKKVADMLSDPLLHLVRNACDHGIESPEERRAAGKPEGGTIILTAAHEGNHLCIRVIDDGRGIDRTVLAEAARRNGHSAADPSDPDLLNLLFLPGFSTSREVSDLSGRGVGLDVVKNAAEHLGGSAVLNATPGKGTEVALSIPTTLGIDTVLFVDAGGKSYALPLDRIVETLKLNRRRLRRAGRRLMFHHRGAVLPADRLAALLEGSDKTPPADAIIPAGAETPADAMSGDVSGAEGTVPVVIIQTRIGPFGLIVDRMRKNMEVATRPLPDILSGMDCFSGVTILGDGGVMLVVNPDRLF